MRVLLVNTSERTGGAAVATNRLMDALNNNGVKCKMLVRDKLTDDITVATLPRSPLLKWNFLWERLRIFLSLRFRKQHLWEVDSAQCGSDITSLREFKEADVIHLSWINQGMLSMADIKKILRSGKPVVWTMHDLWPATGICHYARGCDKYKTGCGDCPLLPGGHQRDLSSKVWKRKLSAYQGQLIHFVACSKWLEREAKQSGLLAGQRVTSIPNPIDTHVYHPKDKAQARKDCGLPQDKKLMLFVSQRVTDPRKGLDYFVEAVDKLVASHPEAKEKMGVVILGGRSEEVADRLALPAYPLGYVNDEKHIVNVYNSADAFVLPSLEDNLPNTIMEAMACGVPCVAFRVGGIPEMIDHKRDGYVAGYRQVEDLAQGVHWVLMEADHEELSRMALHKVAIKYSQHAVAVEYIETYNHAMAFKKCGI